MSCFEVISTYKDKDITLPVRKTAGSAAYDFCAAEDIVIPSFVKQFLITFAQGLDSKKFLPKFAEILTALSENQEEVQKLATIIDEKDGQSLVTYITTKFKEMDCDLTCTLDELTAITKAAKTKLTLVPTGIKCKLEPDQVLHLYARSSVPLKNYLMFGNSVGVIDSDYYNSEENEGHIFFEFINLSPFDIKINKGDIIGQGEITRYCTVDNDNTTATRVGGFGSTNG